jgi:hypothetical protein
MTNSDPKTVAANLYLKHAPPEFLALKTIGGLLENLPQEQAQSVFASVVEKFKDPQVKSSLDEHCRRCLVEIFSKEELELMANFHATASEAGLWDKMEDYGNRLVPLLQKIVSES